MLNQTHNGLNQCLVCRIDRKDLEKKVQYSVFSDMG